MSDYFEKLLELLSIEMKSDKYLLHVRFYVEQDTEVYLEIDKYTAESIESAVRLDEKYKYRLSFTSSWDPIRKQYTSIVTRTYCEQSKPIPFSCSNDYINRLTTLKNCNCITDLAELPFIFSESELLDEHAEEKKTSEESDIRAEENLDGRSMQPVEDEEHLLQKYIHKYLKTSIAAMSAALILLLVFLGCVYISKAAIDPNVHAHAIQSNDVAEQNDNLDIGKAMEEKDVIKNDPDTEKYTDIINVSDAADTPNAADMPTVPYMELGELLTYNLPEGIVALTFDDGPSPYSTEIVDVLKKYEVGGTFFFIGRNVIDYPDSVEYVQQNGYSIGSHSMNHVNMANLSHEKQENEIVQSMKLIEEITNKEIYLFRAPFGSFNEQVKDFIQERQYKMVLWNNDPRDWETRDSDRILNHIKNTELSGSIILMHETRATAEALPKVIELIQEKGLKIISLR